MLKCNKSYIIYKATSPSGKVYIGITGETLDDRISKHKYTSKSKKSKFSNVIRKYGVDCLNWEILKTNLSQTLAIKYEIYFIKKYNTLTLGYNSTKGGDGAFGYKWTKQQIETVHKWRELNYYNNKDYKSKCSNIQKEYIKNNPNVCKKRTEQLVDYMNKNRQKHEQKRLDSMRTKEARLKQSIARGGKKFNVYNILTKSYINTYDIIADCQKELNINRGKITACLKGKRNFTKYYIFKYTDDPTVDGVAFIESWLKNVKRKPNVCK